MAVRKGRTTAPGTRPRKVTPINIVESGRTPVRKGRTVAPGTIPYTEGYTPSVGGFSVNPRPTRNPDLWNPTPVDPQAGTYGPSNEPTGPSGPSFNGGGGGGSGIGGAIAEAPVDPVIAEQQAFIKRLMAMRDETLAGYPASADAIKGYYDTASADLQDPYSAYMKQYGEGAKNLGLDFSNDDNVKLAEVAGRKLQENYDLNETTDLATVEKMKSLNTDSFTQMLVAAEAGLLGPQVAADALALANAGGGGSGGGGGGRRGGGGGSSSNPYSEKATQDEAFYNPGMASAIAGLSDPELRDYADLVYAGTGTNPRSALNRSVSDYEKFAAYKPPAARTRGAGNLSLGYNIASAAMSQAKKQKKAKDMKLAQAAINFFKNWSPGYTPQTTKQTVQTTATTKNKR